MKLHLLFLASILVWLFSCNQKTTIDFDLTTLPTDWISLTETDTGMIVFNSCDAGNLLIKIKNGSEILMHGQQEDYEFTVDEALKNSKDTVTISVHWKGTDDKEEFKFYWVDKSAQLGKWQLLNSGFYGAFVTEKKSSKFQIYNQPCKECWPEEECDEREN